MRERERDKQIYIYIYIYVGQPDAGPLETSQTSQFGTPKVSKKVSFCRREAIE